MKGWIWWLAWGVSLVLVAGGTAYCGYPDPDIDDYNGCPGCPPCESPTPTSSTEVF